MSQEPSPATSHAEPLTVEQWLELAVKGLDGIYKLFKDDGWQPDCSLLHGLSIATGQINEAVQLLKPTPEAVPFFGQPEALLEFLKSAGQGCISGHVSEWPQLRPACRWAAEQIVSARSETLERRFAAAFVHACDDENTYFGREDDYHAAKELINAAPGQRAEASSLDHSPQESPANVAGNALGAAPIAWGEPEPLRPGVWIRRGSSTGVSAPSATPCSAPTKAELMECYRFWCHYSSLNEGAQDDENNGRMKWLDKMEEWAL